MKFDKNITWLMIPPEERKKILIKFKIKLFIVLLIIGLLLAFLIANAQVTTTAHVPLTKDNCVTTCEAICSK